MTRNAAGSDGTRMNEDIRRAKIRQIRDRARLHARDNNAAGTDSFCTLGSLHSSFVARAS